MCLGPNEWGTECGHCYTCTVTGRIPSQPSIPESPAPLNIGSQWCRKRDGRIVTIRMVEVASAGRDGRVHYSAATGGGGYCHGLERWRANYAPVTKTVHQCSLKPPRGLKPRKIHDEERANAIVKAIDRYLREDLPIPLEWVVEYNELHGRLNKRGV